MKRNMKVKAVLIILLLLAFCMSGCNNNEEAQATESGIESSSTQPGGPGGPGGPDGSGGPGGAPGGGASAVDHYDSANAYTTDTEITNESLLSEGTDENAVFVSEGASVKADKVSITRKSDDSTGGDQSSFYGVGAAALVTDGELTISNSTIETDAAGGAGVFAYGDGTATVSDTTIHTTQGTSGGIHVAGGGTLYASNLNVETEGASSAAIRSDRGSGTMVVDGGTYISNGSGSPVIYSTADITVKNATLTANGAEAICIEGLNSIRLSDCNLTGKMPGDNEQNDCIWNVILYQSMSGDSEEGNSVFEMEGGSLKALNGGMFYTTNTESTFTISGVDITYADSNDFFLKCTGNSNARGWGESGKNGADCHFTAKNQTMEGNVLWDTISELDFYIQDQSSLTGAVLEDDTNAGSGGDGYANLYLSKDCSWIVTENSVLSSLQSEGSIVDSDGNEVKIVGTDGTVFVKGNSKLTVTVSEYSNKIEE